MKLIKTDKGRQALRSRELHLTPRERQIVILANGGHSRLSMQELMARDIGAELHRLLQAGYLEESHGEGHRPALAPGAESTQASEGMVPAYTGVHGPSNPAMVAVQSQPIGSRRSLAGAKMYIVDMLQLLRDMDASSMAVLVHSSQGEHEFVQNLAAAARLIVHKCGPSYGLRVVNKLRDILPEVHLNVLHTLACEIEAVGATP